MANAARDAQVQSNVRCCRLGVDAASDDDKQRQDYNRWVGYHNRNNFFVSIPDGRFCAASINHPGRTHDSVAASEVTLLGSARARVAAAASVNVATQSRAENAAAIVIIDHEYRFKPPQA